MVKAQILDTINKTRRRTGWPVHRILLHLGLKKAVYYSWCKRLKKNRLDDQPSFPHHLDQILPEEEEAICDYALEHPRDGYRRLAWMMVDEDMVYLSPSSVYKILSKHDLLRRWKRSTSVGKKPPKPRAPDEQWHSDIMYVWVVGRWYFLVSVIDNYSRFIPHWDLVTSLKAQDVILVIHEALERHSGVHPRIVTDNGSQFTGKEFRQLVKMFELESIKTRRQHPESNGLIERFHRSVREEGICDRELKDLYHARDIIGQWIEHYNNERLHGAIQYLRPIDYYRGNPEELLQIRREKLQRAKEHRRTANLSQMKKLAA